MIDGFRARRWIGWAVLAVGLAMVAWVLPRLLPRSPFLILIVCVLGVLVMKLVESRVRAWFRRLEARTEAELRRTPPRS